MPAAEWKIPQQDATDVFVAESGEIAIRQVGIQDESLVLISVENLPTVLRLLKRAQKIAVHMRSLGALPQGEKRSHVPADDTTVDPEDEEHYHDH